ncbi:MAG: LapA family protein [Gammaproteobacteria bacterium]|nr:LapA family protein [Gammaproteobacteria bacterium]
MKSIVKWKILFSVVLIVLVMIFAVQNAAEVGIRLLFWEVTFPRSLLIFMMLLIGIVIGWILRSSFRIARKSD